MWYTMQIVQLPYHMANLLTPHADKIEKYSTRPVVCVVGVGTFDYGQRNFGFDFFFCRCLDLKLTNNVNFYVNFCFNHSKMCGLLSVIETNLKGMLRPIFCIDINTRSDRK